MANPTSLADDLLTGAPAIAEYVGWNERRIYHAASQGYLPIGRAGQLLIARKSELDRALSPATQNALEAIAPDPRRNVKERATASALPRPEIAGVKRIRQRGRQSLGHQPSEAP